MAVHRQLFGEHIEHRERQPDDGAERARRDPHQAKEQQHQQPRRPGQGRRFAGVKGFFQLGAQRLQRPAQQEGHRQNQQQLGIRKGGQRVALGPALPGKDAPQRSQAFFQARRTEDDQRQPQHYDGVQVAEEPGQPFQRPAQAKALGT